MTAYDVPTSEPAVQARLVAALRDKHVLGGESVVLVETHISYVLLTGRIAYKLKKAVNLGFLDFSTLAARRYYCEEELRLNRRLAPALYLDVVAISGTVEAPALGGNGLVIEYAVKMREFPQDALASRAIARGELSATDIDALAEEIAAFHRRIGVATPDSGFGAPEAVLRVALENFTQLRPLITGDGDAVVDLDGLAAWTEREHASCAAAMTRRREEGFIRECHGDLHLGNIARVDGRLTIFDCIEFSEDMRWIDVISEVAFTAMDLRDRGRPDYAHRFLNAYLEITGDYDGLTVLRFYLVYRAMVRAKIARLRAAQLGHGETASAALDEFRGYLNLAKRYAEPLRAAIVITHGLSGCGKTTLSQALLELVGAIRIRTDVVRKRLFHVGATERVGSGIDRGIYAPEATEQAYAEALALARAIAGAGHVAIVDAAFLKRRQRAAFRTLAAQLHIPFVVVTFAANAATLRQRIARRSSEGKDASDADLAVLEHQLQTQEPLTAEEQKEVASYDAEATLAEARSSARWGDVLRRLGRSGAVPPPVDPDLAAKVAFLSQPRSYSDPTTRVDRVETHMSMVFLTDRFAYKLKKPVRFSYLDFSTEPLRHGSCDEELRLNRRLSADVYLDTVALGVDADGELHLGPGGRTVDWLVKMRRLPADRMLDRMIRERRATADDMRSLVGRLSRFYLAAPSIDLPAKQYRASFAEGIDENRRELCAPAYALPTEQIEAVCTQQRSWLERQTALLDRRVAAGHIVEAHGDLRPEHICLESQPQIIDCLEFSREFRTLDPADELAFLALECERLGAPALRRPILETYAEVTGDTPSDGLLHFYQSHRACVRARIAIWHLNDADTRDPGKWVAHAMDYLRLARDHIERSA